MADLQQPTPIDVTVGFDASTQTLWFGEGGVPRAGYTPEDGSTDVELLVNLADYLQEQFFPETSGAWGQARPVCPGHPHPASADEIAGEAWWVCPLDSRLIATIGQVGGAE
jgi:hypothetical protein